jgi:hypothetical protein
MALDPKGTTIMIVLDGICKDCTVLSGKVDYTMADGTRADVSKGVYNHHLLTLDLSKKGLPFIMCPNSPGEKPATKSSMGAGFMGSGNDESYVMFTSPDGNFDAGYVIGKNDNILMEGEVVNYSPTKKSIYVTMEIEYLSGAQQTGFQDISNIQYSSTGCKQFSWKPKLGETRFNMSSEKYIVEDDSTILNASE